MAAARNGLRILRLLHLCSRCRYARGIRMLKLHLVGFARAAGSHQGEEKNQ